MFKFGHGAVWVATFHIKFGMGSLGTFAWILWVLHVIWKRCVLRNKKWVQKKAVQD